MQIKLTPKNKIKLRKAAEDSNNVFSPTRLANMAIEETYFSFPRKSFHPSIYIRQTKSVNVKNKDPHVEKIDRWLSKLPK